MSTRAIDRRRKISCDCHCGQRASLPHFRIVIVNERRRFILPGCEKVWREEQAAAGQLREMVRRYGRWVERVPRVMLAYRLQRVAMGRKPNGRLLALRSALIFGLPRKLGLLVARVWKW